MEDNKKLSKEDKQKADEILDVLFRKKEDFITDNLFLYVFTHILTQIRDSCYYRAEKIKWLGNRAFKIYLKKMAKYVIKNIPPTHEKNEDKIDSL